MERDLLAVSRLDDAQLFEKYRTEPDGLNQVEAAERLEEYGRNIIDVSNENSLLSRIKDALINPFNIVLMIVALVTLFTDVILSDEPNPATFIMLVLVIIISGVIAFIQSEKSNSAAQKLQKMISNRIDVIRNGSSMEIDIEEAVPGDVVKLASGDMIPGDVRFIEAKDLFIDQSQLTGESNPVEKFAGPDPEGDSIDEIDNIGFMGSNIVSGSAKAVILSTGNSTYFGSMAKSLNTFKDKSSFEENLSSISRLLISFMVVMVPVIFIANFITKGNWLQSLMFGVISQTVVIHTIRTPKIPFLQDRASRQLTLSTLAVCLVTLLIGFTGLALFFSLPVMPITFLAWIVILMVIYTILAQIMKVVYIRINKEWV